MKYSLVSREVIADCIETAVQGQWMDGVVVIGGCDKNMPGGMIGLARMNVPGIYVYGGTIRPGNWKGKDLTIVSSFEAVGEFTAGRMSQEDFEGHREERVPVDRLVRRHVHRQHDELVVRGARHVAAVFVDDGEPRSGKGRLRRRIGARAGRSGQEGPEAARHHHEEVDRERRRADHGDRRLDQRRAALSGDRARGRSGMDHRRLRAHAEESAGDLRPEAVGPVRRDRPAQGGRHSAGAEASCSMRACCTAIASRSRAARSPKN